MLSLLVKTIRLLEILLVEIAFNVAYLVHMAPRTTLNGHIKGAVYITMNVVCAGTSARMTGTYGTYPDLISLPFILTGSFIKVFLCRI